MRWKFADAGCVDCPFNKMGLGAGAAVWALAGSVKVATSPKAAATTTDVYLSISFPPLDGFFSLDDLFLILCGEVTDRMVALSRKSPPEATGLDESMMAPGELLALNLSH
jgi:hypothetical protein